ncbi:MIP/aquaporin family protein [soil metagenome]
MADEITPLRGEGRRIGRVGGTYGELLSEFLGTFVLISFGDGVVAMAVAALPGSGRTANPTTFFLGTGDWLLITFGWAMAVMLAVYVAGGVSGAHINPAVTLAFAVRRKFPWAKVAPYMGAQIFGAFVGAALVYVVYNDAMVAFEEASKVARDSGEALVTYSIFATFPAGYYGGGFFGPLIDQIVGTAFLVMVVVAVIDSRNQAVQANLGPLIVGLIVAAIGMSYGANAGYAINPARDFGPRLFAWIAGWGDVALPGSLSIEGLTFSNYFWVPIVGPLIGGVIGVLIYDFFVGDVLYARDKPPHPGRGGDPDEAEADPSDKRQDSTESREESRRG